jgi:hypothetical protein
MTARPAITPEEIQRRREADRQALASNRIEGIKHDPATDPIFEAWILGEIDVDEVLARIKAYLHIDIVQGK